MWFKFFFYFLKNMFYEDIKYILSSKFKKTFLHFYINK